MRRHTTLESTSSHAERHPRELDLCRGEGDACRRGVKRTGSDTGKSVRLKKKLLLHLKYLKGLSKNGAIV